MMKSLPRTTGFLLLTTALSVVLPVSSAFGAFRFGSRSTSTSAVSPTFTTPSSGNYVGAAPSNRPSCRSCRDRTTPSSSSMTTTTTTTSLSVLIYGWDGEDDPDCPTDNIFGDDSNAAAPSVCSPVGVALAESIQGSQEKVGTLARLAVAFSPPERKLDLESIENVHIVCVNEEQIEIEAILCEDHGCVSLYVPIHFPQECGPDVGDDVLEQCVMDNLHYLDVEANGVITRQVQANKVESEINKNEELRELESQLYHPLSSYPNWWLPPETAPVAPQDLVAECDNIRLLLAEDEFRGDVDALARKGLEAMGLGGEYAVRKAVVTAVGPSGLCLRAMADFTSGSVVVMDIPLPFGGEPHGNPEALRAAVLGEVAAAHVM